MGASSFIEYGTGTSAREVFSDLCAAATDYYGSDPYSGTIATTKLRKCIKVFGSYDPKNEKEAEELVEKLGNGDKWECDYIDLGVCGYVVRRASKKNSKSDSVFDGVFRMEYIVFDVLGVSVSNGHHFLTQKEADDFAVKLGLKNGKCYDVRKVPVLIAGNNKTTEVVVTETTVTKKPRFKESDTCRIFPVHKYLFFGFAAD